tara:strand:- start:4299 stop:7229 length:2931 start_codon:yes stop_codon:yes gene_type:complete
MEGQNFSHYEVLERLGGGGMGVVYKALDTKLKRHVALKFLPHELTRDDQAQARFIQEAQAASALDHPNICTIHEIDATPDGQMFIAMAFYDGEPLKDLIDRGAIPVDQAVNIATQIALGLTKAHSAGIVHRDIKPANVMVTKDGFVKIVDFGIAKLLGVTGPTQAGSTLGTVSYMSPEQVSGDNADPRSDVWALGALLYEMLTGQLPFKGENQWAVMNSIANRAPDSARSLRPEIGEDVDAAVMQALEKEPDKRTPTADAMRRALEASQMVAKGDTPAATLNAWQMLRRPALALPAIGVVLALGSWAILSTSRGADERRAREEAIPEMLALIDQDDYVAALNLAQEIEGVIPNDPVLVDALTAVSITGDIVTDPPGADVYVKAYSGSDADWRLLGQSPIELLRLPRAESIQLRLELEGYSTRVIASAVPGYYFGRSEVIELREVGSIPPEMVLVPGGEYRMYLTGFAGGPIAMEPFLIDRYEVTNAQYKEFVDAGGYGDPDYWEGLEFVRDGESLTREQAMDVLVDETGRAGPATWLLGDFPEGQADYPVTGVSWYEAVAYARFRGKVLPTIYHWGRAAVASHNNGNHLGGAVLPRSNFGGEAPRSVSSSSAMGVHGTLDMAGNVKEWAWNGSGDQNWIVGGAWDDDPRMATVRFTAPPFDRSSRHGFRAAKYFDGGPSEELSGAVDLLSIDYRDAQPVSDEVYEVYRRQLVYVPSEFEANVESVDDTPEEWVREHVTIDAGYEDERFSLHIFLPKNASPPYQPLIFFTGLGPFASQPADPSTTAVEPGGIVGALVTSGRALVVPVWNGSYERWDDFISRTGEEMLRGYTERMAEWASDLGRSLDYLEIREDIDAERTAYFGISFGASTSLALLSLEERLRAALLVLPGYPYRELPPETHPVNYIPHVTLPVLGIGGAYDPVFPVETSQRPLFDHLGTPPEDKELLLYDMGHGPFPLAQFLRDVLPWLDEHLGPVN